MTFRREWFSNKIVSSEGYYVRTIGRGTIVYGEKHRLVYVAPEMLVDGWALYPDDMRMGSESGPTLNEPDLRALIVDRIKAVFDFRDVRLDVS